MEGLKSKEKDKILDMKITKKKYKNTAPGGAVSKALK